MHLLQHFHELSLHPKNAKELKGLILQLAVQGKLTKKWREENPELISGENSAEALLEKIKQEKARLVRENKVKKEKSLPGVTDDEAPFVLPESWMWCRLVEACEYIQRGKSPKYTEVSSVPVVSQKCVQWAGFNITRARFITEDSLDKYQDERFLQVGDLLWNSTGDGTVGRVTLFPVTDYERVVADSHVTVVRPMKGLLLSEYLQTFGSSPLIQENVLKNVSGSTKQTELATGTVKAMEFALPPLPEQKAIISIVEQLFAEVEQLEQLTEKRIKLKKDFTGSALSRVSTSRDTTAEWEYLQPHFHSFFNEESNIKKLRETILQLAVQGKLTTRWRQSHPLLKDEALSPPGGGDVAPERDRGGIEPASKLLERIKAEKARLVKEGKIRKEKPLPPVTKEDVPYELPEGWAWCRLGESGYTQTGSTPPKSDPQNYGNFIPFLGPGDISDRDMLYPLEGLSEKGLSKGRFIPKDSLMMVCIGGSIGKCNVNEKDVSCNQQINIITPLVNPVDYIKFSCQSPGFQKEVLNRSTGSATPIINKGKWEALPIPFAPLEEQKAIVAKVKSLMALCDELEEQVREGKQQAEDLMQTVVREVFEGETERNYEQEEKSLPMAAEAEETYGGTVEPISLLEKQVLMMAKVIDMHHSSPYDNLGHVKMEKILHFVEKLLDQELGRRHRRMAAGPADSKRLKAAIKRAKELKYFKDQQFSYSDSDKTYYRFAKRSDFKVALEKYKEQFDNDNEAIQDLIQKFLPKTYEETQIAATVFDVWESLLRKRVNEPTDEEVINEAKYNYHDEKRKIPKGEFRQELKWLKKQGLNPS